MTCDRFAVSRNCCDDAPPENWHIWDNIFWSHTGGAQNSPNPHVVRSPSLSHPFDMDYQSGHIYYTEGDRQGLFRTDAPNDAGQWLGAETALVSGRVETIADTVEEITGLDAVHQLGLVYVTLYHRQTAAPFHVTGKIYTVEFDPPHTVAKIHEETPDTITNAIRLKDPLVDPNGKIILITYANAVAIRDSIGSLNQDGSGNITTHHEAGTSHPVFNHDDGLVYFSDHSANSGDLLSMPAAGGAATVVASHTRIDPARPTNFVYSHRSQLIYYKHAPAALGPWRTNTPAWDDPQDIGGPTANSASRKTVLGGDFELTGDVLTAT